MNLVKLLIRKGHDVYVVAPRDAYSDKLSSVGAHYIACHNFTRSYNKPVQDLLLIKTLRHIYKENKIDCVVHYTHKANIFGGIAAHAVGIKSFACITGLGQPIVQGGLTSWLLISAYKVLSKNHYGYIFENDEDALFFKNHKISKNLYVVNGCGVDVGQFYPQAGLQENLPIIFTYVGRFLKDKGLKELILAAKVIINKYPNVEFRIVGKEDPNLPQSFSKEEISNLLDDNKDIVVIDFQDDILKEYHKMSALILPSYREGLSRTILEAMSCAKPVITTDVAGCRQAIENGSEGILVTPRSVDSLINGIEKYLGLSIEARKNMGLLGRLKAVNQFESEKIALRLYDIIFQM